SFCSHRHRPCFPPRRSSDLILLPRIELHGKIRFRHVPCPHRKADAIAETVVVTLNRHVQAAERSCRLARFTAIAPLVARPGRSGDRKSTRLNSSHSQISYAV